MAGIVALVLLLASGALLGDGPLAGDDVAEVRAYITEDEGMHKASILLGMLVLPFAVLFFAGVVTRIRSSDIVHGEGWGIMALLGAALIGAAAGVGDVLYATAIFRGGEGLDDTALRLLWDGQIVAYATIGIALAALAVAIAVPTFAHRVWPVWYGVLNLVVAVLGILSVISVVSDTDGGSVFGFLSFVALAVWLLVTSILLIVTKPKTEIISEAVGSTTIDFTQVEPVPGDAAARTGSMKHAVGH